MKNNLAEDLLSPVARCPHCGRFMKRGIMNFVNHLKDNCPKPVHHSIDWEKRIENARMELDIRFMEDINRILFGERAQHDT